MRASARSCATKFRPQNELDARAQSFSRTTPPIAIYWTFSRRLSVKPLDLVVRAVAVLVVGIVVAFLAIALLAIATGGLGDRL